MSVPSREQLKARSKHLAKLLQEKYELKVSHGHCLDVVAQLFGIKDWNTASAAAPDDAAPSPESGKKLAPWVEALTQGYSLRVEQPYKREKYSVGGASAEHSIEKGVVSLPFAVEVDPGSRGVVVKLPPENSVSSAESDATLGMVKQRYRQREQLFSEVLGKKAEDLATGDEAID